jgi:hypothetical protein
MIRMQQNSWAWTGDPVMRDLKRFEERQFHPYYTPDINYTKSMVWFAAGRMA